METLKELVVYIILILVIVLIRSYIITPVRVKGISMEPTLVDKEVLFLKKYDKKIKHFDIVVLKYNNDSLIKRVIGMPGDHIKYVDNKLYVNDNVVKESFIDSSTYNFDIDDIGYSVVPKNTYFVLGDNRNNSIDSRSIGMIDKKNIVGKTNFRLFPLNKLGNFNKKR